VPNRRMTSRKVALTAAFLALAAGGTAACDTTTDEDFTGSASEWEYDGNSGPGSGSGVSQPYEPAVEDEAEEAEDEEEAAPQDEVFYCADEEGEIVDEEYCDDPDESSSYFLWHSSTYSRGLTAGTFLDGGDYFAAGDRATRRAFKLPATGKVGNGTVKTNVVGRGSSGGSGVSTGTSGG
jgi:hypothetical protein